MLFKNKMKSNFLYMYRKMYMWTSSIDWLIGMWLIPVGGLLWIVRSNYLTTYTPSRSFSTQTYKRVRKKLIDCMKTWKLYHPNMLSGCFWDVLDTFLCARSIPVLFCQPIRVFIAVDSNVCWNVFECNSNTHVLYDHKWSVHNSLYVVIE